LLLAGKKVWRFLHPSNTICNVEPKSLSFLQFQIVSLTIQKNCTGTGDITDEKDDVVPIVVGSVLAAIIVVVLGLYFVLRMKRGRRPTNAAA
jgi:hypothetical protein